MANYAWQDKAVNRFSPKKIAAIVAACGTGKTRAGVLMGLRKMLPVIIIVPKNITRQWRDNILEIAGPDQKVWVYDAVAEHKDPDAYKKAFLAWLEPEPDELEAMRKRSGQ